MSVAIAKWTLDEYHRMIDAGILDDRRVENPGRIKGLDSYLDWGVLCGRSPAKSPTSSTTPSSPSPTTMSISATSIANSNPGGKC